MSQELRVLLATDRSGVQAMFERVAALHSSRIEIARLDRAGGRARLQAKVPTVAVIDVAIDRPSAQRLAQTLHEKRPSLPMIALVCCQHAAEAQNLSALAAAGVNGLIDLHATPAEVMAALEGAARGDVVIRLRLSENYKRLWRSAVGPANGAADQGLLTKAELGLLDLMTRGLGDREMGERLNLSPHTVKHRIEHLRDKVGMPNRIALAAWAGRYVSSTRAAQPDAELDFVG